MAGLGSRDPPSVVYSYPQLFYSSYAAATAAELSVRKTHTHRHTHTHKPARYGISKLVARCVIFSTMPISQKRLVKAIVTTTKTEPSPTYLTPRHISRGFEDIIRSRGSVRMSYIIHNARDGVNNTPREGASLSGRIQDGLLVK